ncbi:O-antigen ligase family protein [Thiohalophilus thiocyanatoxydans]|nr:O-antigen ligase family protein [Thiohalophilus thiocyanatoxydans]
MPILRFDTINSHKAGLFGLYLFAFFAFLDKAGTVLGLLLMLSAMLVSWRQVWDDYKQDPAVWVAGIFLIYLILHAYITSLEFPHTSEEQWKEARNWGRLIVFLILAWWMRGNTKVIFHCLLLALAGILVRLVIDTEMSDIEKVFNTQRTGFSYPIGFAAILSGAALVAMIIFTPRIMATPSSRNTKILIALAWLVMIMLMLQIQITAASRGVWLATLAVVILYSLSLFQFIKRHLFIYALSGLLVVIVTSQNTELITKRITLNKPTIAMLIEGESLDNVPIKGSTATRLHLWDYGIKRWLERPIFGWGPGTQITKHFKPGDLQDPLDKKQAKKLKPQPHLHNAYITVLSQLGIVGAMILAAALILLVRNLIISHRQRLLPTDVILAAGAVLIVMLISNLTKTRFATLDFQYLATLTAAIAYTSRYNRKEKLEKQTDSMPVK